MKIKLFDEEDMKEMRKMLAQAIISAVRTLVHDGTIKEIVSGSLVTTVAKAVGTATAQTQRATTQTTQREPFVPPREPIKTTAQNAEPWTKPPTQPAAPPAQSVTEPQASQEQATQADLRSGTVNKLPLPPGRKRRSAIPLSKIIKTVAERPAGYITTDQAFKEIGDKGADRSSLTYWIREKQIPAVIVASYKPPTKGLPGRVMVEREALLRRNALRKENVKTHPRWGSKHKGSAGASVMQH